MMMMIIIIITIVMIPTFTQHLLTQYIPKREPASNKAQKGITC